MENTLTRNNTHSPDLPHTHAAQTQSQSSLFIITFVTKELEGNTAPLALKRIIFYEAILRK